MSIRRILCILLVSAICAAAAPKKKPRTSSGVRQDKTRTEQQMRRTEADIRRNQQEALANLNHLNSLNADIVSQRALIKATSDSIAAIDRGITATSDSIAATEEKMAVIKNTFANALRTARSGRLSVDNYALIFSGETFSKSLGRYRYLRTFAKWLENKAGELRYIKEKLTLQKEHLDALRSRQTAAMQRLTSAQEMLLAQQAATKSLVDQLNADRESLNAILREQQQQARELDRELENIIAEEARKAAEEEARRAAEEAKRREQQRLEEEKRKAAEAQEAARKAREEQEKSKKSKKDKKEKKNKDKKKKDTTPDTKPEIKAPIPAPEPMPKKSETKPENISGSFEANKGRLPAPVDGGYKIVKPFGVAKHPSLENVLVENSGIDIQVRPASVAKAVFDGEVTVVFRPSGYQNAVVVRHGKYLTVYGGLSSVSVTKGDKVKTGQALGTIFSNPADGGRSILHFEVRNGREKLDPTRWIK